MSSTQERSSKFTSISSTLDRLEKSRLESRKKDKTKKTWGRMLGVVDGRIRYEVLFWVVLAWFVHSQLLSK